MKTISENLKKKALKNLKTIKGGEVTPPMMGPGAGDYVPVGPVIAGDNISTPGHLQN
jgi:hypothetical protein